MLTPAQKKKIICDGDVEFTARLFARWAEEGELDGDQISALIKLDMHYLKAARAIGMGDFRETKCWLEMPSDDLPWINDPEGVKSEAAA